MHKISHAIVKYYKVTLVIFAVLCILACVAIPTVVKRLNSEVMTYLPEESETTQGLKFLKDNFGINADAMFGVNGANRTEIQRVADKLDAMYYDGDKGGQGFYYADYVPDEEGEYYYDVKKETDVKVITQNLWRYSEFINLYSLICEDDAKFQEVSDIFYSDGGTADVDTDDTYVFILNINFSSSSDEAFEVLDTIENSIVKDNVIGHDYTYYSFGTTKMAKDIFESTLGEVLPYTAAGLAVVILVLFLFTKSWIDPVIILLTLGVSVLLNIGTNIIFPTNSIITFACSSLLQVALSVDYAVFMIHAYREEHKGTEDKKEALTNSIPRAFKSVFASAMTTLGGFVALFFMRFGIGMDMGAVLAKSIFMSFVCVMLLQPAFMVLFGKQMDKWQHRAVEWKFRKPIKAVIKYRSVVVAVLLIAIFPVVLYQSDLALNYFNFVEYPEQDGEVFDMVDRASQQLIIAVPLDIDNPESVSAQYAYLEKINALTEQDGSESVSFVLGLNALISEDGFNSFLANETTRDMLMKNGSALVNNGYTMYTIGLTNGDSESQAAFDTVANIQKITEDSFAGKETYVTGLTQAGRDFAAITPNDFQRVTLASVIFIIFILLITFRSVKHSLILILLIEFGIWLNLGMQRLSGTSINFMSYIVISSIQLGATVDYAILITSKYRDYRKRMLPAHAAYQATTTSVVSVLTSATILAGACFCVKLMSSVLIVSELTALIARSAIISALLTLFVLPAVLAFLDRPTKGVSMPIPEQGKLSHHKWINKKEKSVPMENAQKNEPATDSAPEETEVIENIDDGFNVSE